MNTQNYQIKCPQCGRLPKFSAKNGSAFLTHICYLDCGNTYWTLNVCPKKQCKGHDKTLFIKQPHFNQLIQCKGCQSQFYLFNCPKKQCKGFFYIKKEYYLMGIPITCQICLYEYKQVGCPCGNQINFDKNFKINQGITKSHCKVCNKNVVYTICTNCWKPNYHPESLQLGQRIKCMHCAHTKQFVPCLSCGRTTKSNQFKNCFPYHCDYCYQGFQFIKCPFCAKINCHSLQNQIGPLRYCQNLQCNAKYFVVNCKKCEQCMYFEQFDPTQGRQQNCSRCKFQIKFYFCTKCNKFNNNDSKCINQKCPKPKEIKSYSKQSLKKQNQKKQKNQILEKLNENYTQKQCGSCCQRQRNIVNLTCGHIYFCQECYKYHITKNYPGRSTNLNNNVSSQPAACPICKQLGIFSKVVKYLYP